MILYSSHDSRPLVVKPKLKKTDLERVTLKKAKKEWKKYMNYMDPKFRSKRGCIGMRVFNDFGQVGTLISISESALIEMKSSS